MTGFAVAPRRWRSIVSRLASVVMAIVAAVLLALVEANWTAGSGAVDVADGRTAARP